MTSPTTPYDWKLPDERLIFVRWFVALGLLISIVYTYPLWLTTSRSFPLAPALPIVGSLPAPSDMLNEILLCVALCLLCYKPAAWLCSFIVLDLLVLGLQDTNRLQSWALYFTLMIAALAPYLRRGPARWTPQHTINLLSGISVATYLWSGALKIHPQYFSRVVSAVDTVFVGHLSIFRLPFEVITVALPGIEILGAFALLFSATRAAGVVACVASNLLTLLAFGPFGLDWHTSGWPWHLAMIFVTPRLLWGSPASAREILAPRSLVARLAFMIVCIGLPALGVVGRWDTYLSFGLFSLRAPSVSVVVEQQAFNELPQAVRRTAQPVGDRSFHRLQLQLWSEFETGAPPSSSVAVLRETARSLCPFVRPEEPLLVGVETFGNTPWADSASQEKLMCSGDSLVPYAKS